MQKQSYCVGNHYFSLSIPAYLDMKLGPYKSFRCDASPKTLFHFQALPKLSLQKKVKIINKLDNGIIAIDLFRLEDNGYRFHLTESGSSDYMIMDSDAFFSLAQIQIPDEKSSDSFLLHSAIMIIYAFATAKLDTLLMHASVIKNDNQGIMFLGKSSTGKSTHSQLWIDHIKHSDLLNDDNPVVRIIDDKAWVFGSPWSGKTPCYKNDNAPLNSIVRLRQASANKINRLPALQAYAAILPSCSCMRWEDDMMTGVHRTVEKLTAITDCYLLDCLPDQEAAGLAYSTIYKNK